MDRKTFYGCPCHLNQTMQKFISVNGQNMNVYVQGSGQPLLLVHGFPLDHTMWRNQIEYFSQSMQVIAPDLPGFGKSTQIEIETMEMKSLADELAALVTELRLDSPITYCGLSMGGYVGWQFLKFHQPLVDRVIMCNTRAADDDEATRRGRKLVANQVLKHGINEIASHMPLKLLGDKAPNSLVEEIRQTIRQTPAKSVAEGQLGMARRPNMTAELPEFQMPALLIGGSQDSITPSDEMSRVAEQMPNAKFVDINGAGHMTPLEAPTEFNQIVESFLQG